MWILLIRKLVWKKISQNLRTANTCLNFLISTLPWNSTRLTFWSRRKFEAYQSKHNIKNKKSDTWSWDKKFLPSCLIISILVNKYFWITYWHHNLAVIKGNNCRKIYLMMHCRCTHKMSDFQSIQNEKIWSSIIHYSSSTRPEKVSKEIPTCNEKSSSLLSVSDVRNKSNFLSTTL